MRVEMVDIEMRQGTGVEAYKECTVDMEPDKNGVVIGGSDSLDS